MTYSILISSKQLQTFLEVIVLAAVLLSFVAPQLGAQLYRNIELYFLKIARNGRLSIAVAAAFPMIVRLAILPVFPIPLPYVHDEFSYLLMADTFAHGRIANPPPPESKHFETEYVLMHPTYASQYQPAQGIALAAGQVATGQPWWAVWFSVGLMCGALCWALRAFFPPAWALCGALGAALQFGIFGFWMNSYFGGAIAATGGALVVGALLRLRHRPVRSAVLCAIGLIVLLSSRPFEGLIWTVVAVFWIGFRYRMHLRRIVTPAATVFAVGVAALLLYDYSVTRSPLVPPYSLGRQTYGTPQSFWWQAPVTVAQFDNDQLRDNYLNQLAYWERRTSPRALWDSTWRRSRDFWRFFIGPFFAPALFFLLCLRRDRRILPWLLVSVPFVLDHATYHAWYPQQSATETILIVMIILQCWRHLRVWRRRVGWGIAMSRNLAATFSLAIILVTIGHATERDLPQSASRLQKIWASLAPDPHPRDNVVSALKKLPGKHLVFVRYHPGHPYIDEWVFNQANIPGAKIVFARIVSPDSDAALIHAMKGYHVWLADPDTSVVELLGGSSADQDAALWPDFPARGTALTQLSKTTSIHLPK